MLGGHNPIDGSDIYKLKPVDTTDDLTNTIDYANYIK